MNSADRLLGILRLFSVDKPVWTVEETARAIDVSVSQTYRYINSLVKACMLESVAGGGFVLGSAFVEYDRQIRLCDPMLRAARPIMLELARAAPDTATVLLCRRYHDRVMCVHQEVGRAPQAAVGYERGRPMPILRGAASKAILAHLTVRMLRSIYAEHRNETAAAGLGADWPEFRAALSVIRRQGHAETFAEIDAGRVGLAVPIFEGRAGVIGSLGFALSEEGVDDNLLRHLAAVAAIAARNIETSMEDAAANDIMPGPAMARFAAAS